MRVEVVRGKLVGEKVLGFMEGLSALESGKAKGRAGDERDEEDDRKEEEGGVQEVGSPKSNQGVIYL
jgi:hypothetical protein